MKKTILSFVALSGALVANQAFAHVGLRDLNTYNTFTESVTSDFGWYEGTESTLGNSHDLRWFTFTLAENSYVNLSVSATGAGSFNRSHNGTSFNSVGDLNVGFSLFTGFMPNSTYEGGTLTSDGVKNGFEIPGHGITTLGTNVSPAATYYYGGVEHPGVNALQNDAGEWGVISYITHQNQFGSGETESLSDYFLKAGKYYVLAGGASFPLYERQGYNQDGSPFLVEVNGGTYGVTASFSSRSAVAPVPVPGAVWLFGSAIVGLLGVSRRKQA